MSELILYVFQYPAKLIGYQNLAKILTPLSLCYYGFLTYKYIILLLKKTKVEVVGIIEANLMVLLFYVFFPITYFLKDEWAQLLVGGVIIFGYSLTLYTELITLYGTYFLTKIKQNWFMSSFMLQFTFVFKVISWFISYLILVLLCTSTIQEASNQVLVLGGIISYLMIVEPTSLAYKGIEVTI
ncbi:hypothetical protein FGO68_gene3692 [Halteria grandinella]|uniref:Uncharacterized protein n=1 Tax=Halteria grandinella TaxID=5974 RepID=A0A8J8NIN4_HALGN|nr:hypothetical protein FGO68_gene3692 [Halteria grandinella]